MSRPSNTTVTHIYRLPRSVHSLPFYWFLSDLVKYCQFYFLLFHILMTFCILVMNNTLLSGCSLGYFSSHFLKGVLLSFMFGCLWIVNQYMYIWWCFVCMIFSSLKEQIQNDISPSCISTQHILVMWDITKWFAKGVTTITFSSSTRVSELRILLILVSKERLLILSHTASSLWHLICIFS